jgi:hypothetical protein
VIHSAAILVMIISGEQWQDMILNKSNVQRASLIDYGYSLFIVYLVWMGLVLFLYPFSKRYMEYKAGNRDKWWLSYL